jgi:putative ABC transport system permease protein
MLFLTGILIIIIAWINFINLGISEAYDRAKETGIRNVSGASKGNIISQIMLMLNRDFLQWVGLAFIIATPVAVYLMNLWLKGFAYKTSLS